MNGNLKTNKKGITFNLFYVLFYILASVLVFAILGFVIHAIRGGLNQDIMIGQVNLSNASESTFGVFDDALQTNLDFWGLMVIFGMIGGIFIASYTLRGKWNKLLIVADILIMVVVYIVAVLISNTYESLLIAVNGIIPQFEGQLPKTSNFILHLPRYVVIIGSIAMILFYSAIPRREDELNQPISYQQ